MSRNEKDKVSTKKRRPMSEIAKDIKANRKKRPTQEQTNKLFEILRDEGLAEPLDKVAKSRDPETSI